MRELRGKTSVITGAASGIGRAMALAFAAEGMNVVVADIEQAPADAVAGEVRATGVGAIAVRTDVADRRSVGALADRAYAEFGAVHLLCNNAGVVSFRTVQQTKDSDWDWVLAVNLHGVVYGLQAFLPRLLAQGGEAHIVNTASIAGLIPVELFGHVSYTTSKYAVVGLSESMRLELAADNIGVSVLCPGGVRTRLGDAGRNRPAVFGGAEPPRPGLGDGVLAGMDPADVARMVVRGVVDNRLYILTHPGTKAGVEARFRAILDAYGERAGRRVNLSKLVRLFTRNSPATRSGG